jgi:cytochrome d ubiquinol oxidase subunit I
MDVLALSRLQFAVTSMFHFIFVPLTLGLSILVAYMETRYVRTGDETYLRMTKFWGKLFLINFALGIVTGITMEFQFGMNWAEYSKYVGDIFGAPLAIEATVAFFLESTFIGIWVFGWNRVSKKAHAISIWLVAIATNLSALWILLANGWMQHPVGYTLHDPAFFKRSFRTAATFGLVSSLLIFIVGDFHASEVARTQPTKFAAMEAVWNTQKAVPYNFIVIPDVANERNSVEALGVPKMLSFMAFRDGQAEIKGLKDFSKEDRPPVMSTFVSFKIMIALGTLFLLLTAAAVYMSQTDRLESSTLFLRLMLYSLPLPYLAGQLGWIVAEVGRQPWIVYGVLKTSDAVSKAVSHTQVWASLLGFTLLYGFLAAIDIYLLTRTAKKGPDRDLSEIIKTARTQEV